ncbi:hypothetical protein NIES2101_18985 [Calothrix sp. HK-06]|nr:hypothetical protein NIES2101_18985 [Calothrix sp. HK-06]
MHSIFKVNTWLVAAVVSVASFGMSWQKSDAQTVLDFDTFYDIKVILQPITSDLTRASITGSNPNAPYGLTNFSSTNYSQFNPATGTFTFIPDAAQFGVQGLPVGMDMYFGANGDKLVGLSNATAVIDSANGVLNGSGTVTITGGEGRFAGATGLFSFTESEPLNEDPTAPLRGRAFLKGSFQIPKTVPEPRTDMTLVSAGLIGITFLMRQYINKQKAQLS